MWLVEKCLVIKVLTKGMVSSDNVAFTVTNLNTLSCFRISLSQWAPRDLGSLLVG